MVILGGANGELFHEVLKNPIFSVESVTTMYEMKKIETFFQPHAGSYRPHAVKVIKG